MTEGAMPAHVVIGLAAAMQDACPPHGSPCIRRTAFIYPGWVAPVRLWHHSIQRLCRGGCASPALQWVAFSSSLRAGLLLTTTQPRTHLLSLMQVGWLQQITSDQADTVLFMHHPFDMKGRHSTSGSILMQACVLSADIHSLVMVSISKARVQRRASFGRPPQKARC